MITLRQKQLLRGLHVNTVYLYYTRGVSSGGES